MSRTVYTSVCVFCCGLITVVILGWVFKAKQTKAQANCGQWALISSNIEDLSLDGPKGDDAFHRIASIVKGSPECRDATINELTSVMNKPHLDFEADRSSYFLWSNGALMLANLQAVEALDLLIDHLDDSDGFTNASMTHQPAMVGVRAMGAVAVPKLIEALKVKRDPQLRIEIAMCLLEIGGTDAKDALRRAAVTDPDQCVRHYIELAIISPEEQIKAKGGVVNIESIGEILTQRVDALRCGRARIN